MKKALTLYLSLLFATIATAQNLQWAKALEGESDVQVVDMVVDDLGNVYTVGRFSGIADFDPGENSFLLNAGGNNLGFISKIDKNGNFVWAKNIEVSGTSTYSRATNIAIDSFGKIVIVGDFKGVANFNPTGLPYLLSTKTNANARDLFVMKIEPNGDLIWAKKSYGSDGYTYSITLAIDKHSAVYIGGRFANTVNFNPDTINEFNLTAVGDYDIFVLKLKQNGSFEWVKKYGGGYVDNIGSISLDPNNNLVISGSFRGTADFYPDIGEFRTASFQNLFILKLDSSGVFQWVKQIFPSNSQTSITTNVNHKGEIIASGRFAGTVNLDSSLSNYTISSGAVNNFDSYIAKYQPNGNLIWAKHIATESNLTNCYPNKIFIDNYDNVHIVGFFTNNVDFDPSAATHFLTSNGYNDIFVAQYDSLGEFVWAKSMGGKMNDYGNAVLKDPYGSLYVAGIFADTVEFELGDSTKTLIAKGYQNSFICKFANCKDTFVSNDTVIICSGSSFWVGNKEHTVSGDFLDTFRSHQGCDSIVLTHLIVLPPPDTLLDVTLCAGQSYFIANNEYWESGTYVDTIKTTEGCDSIVTTNLTVAPAPEFILPVFLCEGETYNFNGRILNSEGRYTDTLSTTEGCDSLSTVEISFYSPIVARIEERLPILRALPSGANYQWYDCNNNFTPVEGADSQDFHPPYNGLFAVRVTQGECEEISECLPYFKQYGIYMPNSFSPNGDGKNDTYRPVAEGWVVARMTVYNRWGELLFDSQDPQAAWDGTYKNDMVQAGVYLIRVTFNSIETGSAPFRSVTENVSVHLVR